MTKYYSLMVYENGFWSQQFGDYDKSVVRSEYDDYRDHGYRTGCMAIVCTDDSQAAIEAEVNRFNRKEREERN